MITVLAIIYGVVFVLVLLFAFVLGIADAINVSSGEKSIYPEPEDFE